MDEKLPQGWVWTTLGEIALVNPGSDISLLPDSTLVSFIPMAAVEAGTGRIDSSITRKLKEVRKGYTAFQENDILFAKITPCMENGKVAVAQSLSSGIGFGSTEFHILRPENSINPHLIYYYLSQELYRQHARVAMTGSAGQLRVPATFLKETFYPLAPLPEQHRIVAAIEQQFTRLDSAVASLQSARERTKQYRASLLKAAVEGELTKDWRAEHLTSETGAQLLARILKERRARWEEEQLAKMREKGVVPRDNKWKEAYKEPQGPNVENLPKLPEGWCWATVEQVSYFVKYGTSAKTSNDDTGVPVLRMGNIQDGALDFSNLKYLPANHPEFPELLLQKGDMLFNRTNSLELVGKSAIYRGNFPHCSYASYLICVQLLIDTLANFLCFYINSHYGKIWIKNVYTQQTGQANVNGSKLQALAFPLPPTAEIVQIVAEVDARLSNLAQLEATIEANLKRAEHERQSILREAFAGRLVEQDPGDEPASVLLERIREERKRREATEKELKKNRKGDSSAMVKRRRGKKSEHDQKEIGLYRKLVEVGKPLPPDDLFKQVGLKTEEQPESTEGFYGELDEDVEAELIVETRLDDTHVLLEAVEQPPEDSAEEEQTGCVCCPTSPREFARGEHYKD